ncbi:MerR family transcriptional regulator [Candidatus Poriferisodalis sp.]|uniref:MerR family transcriptional regulator n=1 Tax=Candidatus Poriferisodalis sp. TaxID=3101277 RepID=UPI003B02B7B4
MANEQLAPSLGVPQSGEGLEPPPAMPSASPAEPSDAGAFSEGFAGPQTAQLVGITYRQLDHWARKGLVKPSVADAAGSGSRRRYSYNDLVELKIAKKMRDQGIDLRSIARAFEYLRDQLGGEVASANIVISGTDVLLVDEDQVLSLLRQGQSAMLTVLPVAGVRRELDADVVKLFPDEPIATQLSLDLE